MGTDGVVLAPPLLDQDLRLRSIPEPLQPETLVPKLAVKALVRSVLQGFPGSISAVSIFASVVQCKIARETNSGPLSDRRCRGAPRTLTSFDSTSITRCEQMLPPTSIARHSRVNSSTTVKHFSVCPLAHASNTKSYAHT